MKRFFSLLITAVLLFALISMPASANASARIYLTGPSSASVGSTVKVALNIEGSYEVHILNVKVNFDPGCFRYVSNTLGDVGLAFSGLGMAMCNITATGRAVSFGGLSASDAVSTQGVVAEITFEVLSTATASTALSVDVEEFAYMPISSTTATSVSHTESGLTVSISGGSGSGTGTTTPRPIGSQDPANTPGALPTDNTGTLPIATDNGSKVNTNTPGPETQAPEATETQTATKETPEPGSTEEPVLTGQPGEETTNRVMSGTMKTVFFAALGVLGAVLILVVVLLILRSSKEKKKRN